MLVEYARIVPSLSCIKRNLNSIKKSQSRISSNYNMGFHLKTIHSTSVYLKQKKYIYSKSTNPQFAVLQQITPILELESVSITQGKTSQLVLHDLTSPNQSPNISYQQSRNSSDESIFSHGINCAPFRGSPATFSHCTILQQNRNKSLYCQILICPYCGVTYNALFGASREGKELRDHGKFGSFPQRLEN